MLSGTQYMLQKKPCTRLPFACILCLDSVHGNYRRNSGVPDHTTERRPLRACYAWVVTAALMSPYCRLGPSGAAVPGDVETELAGHFKQVPN